MGDPSVLSLVQNIVVLPKPALEVIGVQYRIAGSIGHSFFSQKSYIPVGYKQYARTSPRSRRYRSAGLLTPYPFHDGVSGKMRGKMGRDAYGAHSRTSSSMWNAESLVQVYVAYVNADKGGKAEAHLRVKIRPVHVYLRTA